MNLVEYIFRNARDHGRWDEPAIVCAARQVNYAELLRQVRQFAGLLWHLQVQAGERVAIVARDCPEWVVAFLGTAAVGAVAVPASTMLTAAEFEYVLEHSGAVALVLSSEQLEKLAQSKPRLHGLRHCLLIDGPADGLIDLPTALAGATEATIAPVADDALAFLLYTSGSTGRPKGVMHLHRNLPYTVETFCKQVLRVESADRLFSSSRLFFAYGLGNSLSFPLSTGATAILCAERPTPAVIADVLRRQRPTIFCAVPAVYRALLEYQRQGQTLVTDSLKVCVSAGEKLPAALWHEWHGATALNILDGIGSTEMLHMFITNTHTQITPGSTGRVVPGYAARLLDQAGHEIAGAGTGDLLIKGGSAFAGYWRDAGKTAATITGDWIRTGDIYRRDESGDYWFEGRSDDLFKVKGLWVAPVEVEETLLACPEVAEAAVVPGTDATGMTMVVAYIVLKEGQAAEAEAVERLRAQVAAQLPAYKCPAQINFVPTLPRTATGKLQRYKLRAGV
ncbi:MAG TPA: benzoate-CoA ligase family protein [Pyrinomonadaceae bacterium]|jgi:4-hydroxybenzoate-CoA ligase